VCGHRSDQLPAHPTEVPETPSLSTISASKLVVFIEDSKIDTVGGTESGARQNVIVLHVHDTADPTVFAMCLAQMARRLKCKNAGVCWGLCMCCDCMLGVQWMRRACFKRKAHS
jgi:hypothetical protein